MGSILNEMLVNLLTKDTSLLRSIGSSRHLTGTTLYRKVLENKPKNLLQEYTYLLKKYIEDLTEISISDIKPFLTTEAPHIPRIMWEIETFNNLLLYVISGVDYVAGYYATELDRFKEDNEDVILRLNCLYIIDLNSLEQSGQKDKIDSYINARQEEYKLQGNSDRIQELEVNKLTNEYQIPYAPHDYKPYSAGVIEEYKQLLQNNYLEPRISAYTDDLQLLIDRIKAKMQEPAVEELMTALRSGYEYSSWEYPQYLKDKGFDVSSQSEYSEVTLEILSDMLGIPGISCGSRRIAFDLGDYVLKLWYRTNTQHVIEMDFLKEQSDMFVTTLYQDSSFTLTNKCVTLDVIEDDNTYNVNFYSLVNLCNLTPTGETSDVELLIEFLNGQLQACKKKLYMLGYNIEDLTSNIVGIELNTGKFKIIDAGYIYSPNNTTRQLRNLNLMPYFYLQSKTKRLSFSCITAEDNNGTYIVRNYAGDSILKVKSYPIHESRVVSDACLALSIRNTGEQYMHKSNITKGELGSSSIPSISFAEILEF